MQSKVLFLDDRWEEEGWKESFDQWVPETVTVVYEKHGYEALRQLREHPQIKLVFLDLQFQGQPKQGEQILNDIKDRYPELKVIILTSINDSQLALRLVHLERKAYYYFFKDALDPAQVKKFVENAIESYDLKSELIRKTDIGLIIGEGQAMKEVLRLAMKASQADTPVLLTGESGTGKELIARTLHMNGVRRGKPLVAVNCATVPEGLVEATFFGHEKGAFTGAVETKRGCFEVADGGTLFLDEVAEMKPDMQAKLLRVLQSGEFQRVGGGTTRKVNVRIVAATNRHLPSQIQQGLFREDLYYRLCVFPIHLPPLRERREDIEPLTAYHLQRLNNSLRTSKELGPDVLSRLSSYAWPGNIRELTNTLERAILLSDSDMLGVSDFSVLTPPESSSPDSNLIQMWVERAAAGDVSWEYMRSEFAASGEIRRKIIEGMIISLKQRHRSRPTGDQLAKLLKIDRRYLNVILNSLGLRLTDY
jgi:DNA-binding NtrC family response regulator